MLTSHIIPVIEGEWKKNSSFNDFDQSSGKLLSKKAESIGFSGKKDEVFSVFTSNGRENTETYVVGMGNRREITSSLFQKTIAQLLRKIAAAKIETATISLSDRMGMSLFDLGRIMAEALYLSQYRFDKYKSKKDKGKERVLELKINIKGSSTELQRGYAWGKTMCEGVNLSRDLVNEPALHLTPSKIADEAKKIAAASNGKITIKILEEAECKKLGMGAYLSVSRGSDESPKFIVLHYKGKGKKKICLIGKTILFDSGGLSIKPSKGMETMKMDMAGGATVLGVFKILGNPAFASHFARATAGEVGEIWGILPACENMPSGKASRPGDIVSALNGKSIEILNTDAEGRMALADALSYAEKYIKPDYIVDLATLTGAIMVALGEDITGMFANDKKLSQSLIKAADEEYELLWEMPLHMDYKEHMKSKVADLKNISGTGYGGAITAAVFLSEFVDKSKWAHLDIAGAAFNEGGEKGMTPTGGTGWGVKTIVRWLTNQK